MTASLEAPTFGSEISECDREPIHIPGSIQPHGLLLIAQSGSLRIIGGAGLIEDQFGSAWLGQPVSALLGDTAADALTATTRQSCLIGAVAGTPWEATARRMGDCIGDGKTGQSAILKVAGLGKPW